jgi:nucleotide-binding universal stress UspA family protein
MARSLVNHILLLVDGTKSSFQAADYAIDLARTVGARLTALAVVDTDTLKQLLNVKILVDSEMAGIRTRTGAERSEPAGRSAAARDEQTGQVRRRAASGNSEVIVPIELAQRNVDLLVMGAFQSERVKHDLIARQRQQILDRAACPIQMMTGVPVCLARSTTLIAAC